MSTNNRRVLYIGGTGTISAACVTASVRCGDEVHVVNRGSSTLRSLPAGVHHHQADIRTDDVGAVLGGLHFDAVVDFLCYTGSDAERAIASFTGRTDQYVFTSSASVYRKPVGRFPTTESTPLRNPFLPYARDKIAAEQVLMTAWREREFPVTVVRPSHTYDDARPPLPGDWTVVDRVLRGAEVVISGDGTSPWTVTHADDLAVGLVGLLGVPRAIGEAFHITSDEVLTWDAIHQALAAAAGVAPRLLHLSADLIAAVAPDWRWSELIRGDLSHSAIFDTTKIRTFVPAFRPVVTWDEGVRRILRWRVAHPASTVPDPQTDAILDRLVQGYHQAETVLRTLAPWALSPGPGARGERAGRWCWARVLPRRHRSGRVHRRARRTCCSHAAPARRHRPAAARARQVRREQKRCGVALRRRRSPTPASIGSSA